jgi:hypothetical protein
MDFDRTELERVRDRMKRLENKHRRHLAVEALLLVGLGSILLMGQGAPKRMRAIDAEAFVLVDDGGKERAQLTVNKEGAVALGLKSTDGVADANLGVLADGTITFRLRNPRKSVVIDIAAEGSASIRMNEKYAKSALELGIDAGGKPRIVMSDAEGKAVFKAP